MKQSSRTRRQPPTSSRGRGQRSENAAKVSSTPTPSLKSSASAPAVNRNELIWRLMIGMLVLSAGIWAYFPTLREMVSAWEREPDYSHGFLVAPMAVFFLWLKRKSFPGFGKPSWIAGLLLVLASVALRLFAGAYFYDSIDAWSMLLWLAGAVCILLGGSVFRWAGPALAFLLFMVPLPFRIEGALSLPLQRVATKASCWGLQMLGQPAIAEGNTILLGEHELEVEQACSGLRLFVSITALAFVYLALVRRDWWEKAILLASVVPIAIFANSLRIVVTGVLYELVSSDAAKQFSHDFAGWATIPVAGVLFASVLWYLRMLFQEREQIDMATLVRQAKT